MICLYGGTFDPVHNGHLHAARTVCDLLSLSQLRLILSARPSHRADTGATIEQRFEMLQLACAEDPRLIADDREIHRQGPSYTVDTLVSFRSAFPDESLCWVIGWDAYRLLTSWHRWQQVAELANLIVVQRPGQDQSLSEEMQAFTDERSTGSLAGMRAGGVLIVTREMLPVSAAEIRELLMSGRSAAHLLPEAVATYISEHNLYGVVSDP